MPIYLGSVEIEVIVDCLSDDGGGCTVDIPVVGEGVVTCVAGGGCELDCGAFVNIRGDIDGINRGGNIGDGDLDGVGGAGSVVVSHRYGDVMSARFGKHMGL